jgi:LPPG:FO 2-phospho-L-lactate transferase
VKIAILSGGVGGARFIRGVREACRRSLAGTSPEDELTAIVNVGDDMWLTGLRIAPDLDSVMYTLAGESDEERGWGRVGDTSRASSELRANGIGWPWFTLGDLDIGTHLSRTELLRQGLSLSEATARLASRWPLGVTLLPSTDDETETHVRTRDGETMHFQEWWTRHRAQLPVERFIYSNVERAHPAPGVVEAIRSSDLVLFAPSNPIVSIGPIVAIPEIAEAIAETRAPVVGVSPIIAGSVVRGMADACLDAVGVATSADAVAVRYGSRAGGGLIDAWLIDESDAALAPGIESAGIRANTVPLWMRDLDTSAALAAAAISFATVS